MTINDFERLRREMSDKSNINELLELKSKVMASLEKKVELKEV